MQNNFKMGWKTTLVGLVLLLVDLYYLLEKDGKPVIFFGVLLVSLGLFFAPDDLVKGIKNLIKKNQHKEF